MKAQRRYPSRPFVGAGAVVHRGNQVLLIRRKYPPNERKWALPGGLVELGERVQDAAAREVLEETGLKIEVEGLLDVATDIHVDRGSKLEYHYVLVDYVAKPVSGRLRLNAESSGSGWFSAQELKKLEMSSATSKALKLYFARGTNPTAGSAGRRPTMSSS